MFELFDSSARELWSLAGNLAAERRREELGVKGHVHGVQIRVSDVRRAYHLIVEAGGWQGGVDQRLATRMRRRLPTVGKVTMHDLGRAMR